MINAILLAEIAELLGRERGSERTVHKHQNPVGADLEILNSKIQVETNDRDD